MSRRGVLTPFLPSGGQKGVEQMGGLKRAMVLAAGYGTRMRPLTLKRPKPLIPVLGTPLLAMILHRLAAVGVEQVVINSHYLGEQIENFVKDWPNPRVISSPERTVLDTGGGIVQALPHLGPSAFYVMNSDLVWLDDGEPALVRLAQAWDARQMSGLLLLQPTEQAAGYRGDYFLDPGGCLRPRGAAETAPYVFTGLRVMGADAFADAPDGAFSVVEIFNRLIAQGRLYGLVHHGAWFNVGTPQGLTRVEESLRARGIESVI